MEKEKAKDWGTILAQKLSSKGVDTAKLQAQAQSDDGGLTEEDFAASEEQVLSPDQPSDPLAQQTLAIMNKNNGTFEYTGPAKELREALSHYQIKSEGNRFGLELGNQFRFVINAEANPAGAFQCHVALLMGFGEQSSEVGEVGSIFTSADEIKDIVAFVDDMHSAFAEVNSLYSVLGATQVRL